MAAAGMTNSLSRISNLNPSGTGSVQKPEVGGTNFKDLLKGSVGTAAPSAESLAPPSLKFSNHAIDRMRSRGIHFDKEVLGRIENAVAKASEKGAKETLLLTDDSALIVSVKNNTVVTVMDKQSLKDNVFTNIDSTVVI